MMAAVRVCVCETRGRRVPAAANPMRMRSGVSSPRRPTQVRLLWPACSRCPALRPVRPAPARWSDSGRCRRRAAGPCRPSARGTGSAEPSNGIPERGPVPPGQVSPDPFAVVLDGMLEADSPTRARALACPATQAVQVGPEVLLELPRDPAAASVGNRTGQQTPVAGLLPRIEQLARLNSGLDRTCHSVLGSRPPNRPRRRADEPRSEDDRDDEKDLNSDPAGHRERDHPACALTLRSRAPQLVFFPGPAASTRGGREPGHDVRHSARKFFPSIPAPALTQLPDIRPAERTGRTL